MPASIIAVGIFCLLVTARAAACRRWPLLGIFGGAACGLAGLGAVALLGPFNGRRSAAERPDCGNRRYLRAAGCNSIDGAKPVIVLLFKAIPA